MPMRFLRDLASRGFELLPSFARRTGERIKPPEIKKVHVGFQTYHKDEQTAYKVGLWTPVYVEVFGGTDGIEPRPDGRPLTSKSKTVDSEDVGTRIHIPVSVKPLASRTFIGYVKTGRMGRGSNEVTVT